MWVEMKFLLFLAVSLFLLSTTAKATVVFGNVYDSNLELVQRAIVQINTTPTQTIVTQNGSFTFNVPKGSYQLTTKVPGEQNVTDDFEIRDEGEFQYDIILPYSVTTTLPEETTTTEQAGNSTQSNNYFPYLAAIVLIAISVIAYYFQNKRKEVREDSIPSQEVTEEKKERKATYVDSNEEKEIMGIIERAGGRITQRELRKETQLSEAMVSMTLTELEKDGKIEKIKKGRGNIIKLLKPVQEEDAGKKE